MPSLPIHEILVEDRQRKDYGDIADLSESLKNHGLIQPVIVTQDKKLVAGGRRLAAARSLGWIEIPVAYKEVISKDELHILELEENLRRLNFSWQEQARCIATIHREKCRLQAKDFLTWTQEATGELLGISLGSVSTANKIDRELSNPNSPLWKMSGITEALAWFEDKAIKEGEAELARRGAASMALDQSETAISEAFISGMIESASEEIKTPHIEEQRLATLREQYLSNPLNDPAQCEAYIAERIRRGQKTFNTINLSSRFRCCDAITFLKDMSGRFDHIITDPPYAIDMDMIQQQNTGQNIESVRDTHQVDDNLQLLESFIMTSYDTLKDQGFLVFWCDQMQWQYLFDCAIDVGFSVQRWPFVWCKTSSCSNQAAQYNFTKRTEIAMICRKGGITLVENGPDNYVVASSNDEITAICDHPFAKPYAVWEPLINAVSLKGQSIIEPFCGAGSGILSILKSERNVFACELIPTHFNHMLENVKQWYRKGNPDYIFV